MKYGNLTFGQMEAVLNKLGGMDGVALLLADEIVLTRKEVKTTPSPEPEISPIIRVDYSISASYPSWMKERMHPELQRTGTAEYDINKVEQWLHDDQKDGKWMKGDKIYAHLKKTDTLKTCLGLRDLEEIQKKGITFFRKYFKGKVVFGWRDIVRNRNGSLNVPYLYENGDKVILDWDWADNDWYDYYPTLRLAS